MYVKKRQINLVFPLTSTLTDAQRAAILRQGSTLLIIAGPGSGKTEVISWRVAHLVTSGRAGPEQILALTFTNKAALGLKDRIQSKLPAVNAELMQISTFHVRQKRLFLQLKGKIIRKAIHY